MTTAQKLTRLLLLPALVAVVVQVSAVAQIRVAGAGGPAPTTNAPPMGPVTLNGTGIIVGQVIEAGTTHGVAGVIVTLGNSTPGAPQAVQTTMQRMVINAGAGGPTII